MQYCPVCGLRLTPKRLPQSGEALWCSRCGAYRFPVFSTAVAATVLSEDEERMLLIWQYGEPEPVLPAGYVDKGETAEQALARELREELGVTVRRCRFIGSRYYAPSETLMLHFAVTVPEERACPNWEIDAWRWVEAGQALSLVKPGGLAEQLLRDYEERKRE